LADETFKKYRFSLKVHDPSKQYQGGIYHGKYALFMSAIGGNAAKVSIDFKTPEIPFQYLLPVHPMDEGQLVVPISGPLRGQFLKVAKYNNDGRCALKDATKPLPRRKDYKPPVMQSDHLASVTGLL
jgi:hypothetical protein